MRVSVAICRLAYLSWYRPAEGFSWAGPRWQGGEVAKMHVYRCPLLLRWRRDKQFRVLVRQQIGSGLPLPFAVAVASIVTGFKGGNLAGTQHLGYRAHSSRCTIAVV
jgi:hypothetical protein